MASKRSQRKSRDKKGAQPDRRTQRTEAFEKRRARSRPIRRKGERKFEDFRVILDLPPRLTGILLELFAIEKVDWDLCMSVIRQHKVEMAKAAEIRDNRRLAYQQTFRSKGRGKGHRVIHVPNAALKDIQKKMLQRFLATVPVHSCRHANVAGASVLSNATRHQGAKAMFSIDVINAFPSVFRSRVRANLAVPLKHRLRTLYDLKLPDPDFEQLLDAVCDLVCYEDVLPQGTPTSPKLLDIVMLNLDREIWKLLQEHQTVDQSFVYTAWADDLTISSNLEIDEALRTAILTAMKKQGFIPHTRPDKTVYMSQGSARVPCVTGLVIHEGSIGMTPGKRSQMRARLHNLLQRSAWDESVVGEAAGLLGYIRSIYPPERVLPSNLRKLVGRAEDRMIAERAIRTGRQAAAITSNLPPGAQARVIAVISRAET